MYFSDVTFNSIVEKSIKTMTSLKRIFWYRIETFFFKTKYVATFPRLGAHVGERDLLRSATDGVIDKIPPFWSELIFGVFFECWHASETNGPSARFPSQTRVVVGHQDPKVRLGRGSRAIRSQPRAFGSIKWPKRSKF